VEAKWEEMKGQCMKKKVLLLVLSMVGLWGNAVFAQSDPNSGLNVWTLLGTTPNFARAEEIRVGYEGLLPKIEFAVSGIHVDGPEEGQSDWVGRFYAIAHALDAKMITHVLGNEFPLPEGNLYGGLFVGYAYHNEHNWSAGWLVGGSTAWPWDGLVGKSNSWSLKTVVEYQADIWNANRNAYTVSTGLLFQFR
jgi:hypothetical protein